MTHLYSIGHSTRTAEEFIELLREHDIRILIDVGIGLTSIAAAMRLDSIPIAEEQYDFLVEKRVRSPYVHGFLDILRSREFQRQIEAMPGVEFCKDSGRTVSRNNVT